MAGTYPSGSGVAVPPRITKAEAFYLPLRYQPFKNGPYSDQTLDHILLRLETDEGLVGWGEAFGYAAAAMTYVALNQVICPFLIGLQADDIASTFDTLDQKLHQAGRHGAVLFALSAVDIALWDIAGKRASKSVADLLGGVQRSELPAYASLLRIAEAELLRRRVGDARGEGFQAIKLHEIEPKFIITARDAWPIGQEFMLDINCGWDVETMQEMDKLLADYKPAWFEEPIFPPEDFQTLAALRQSISVPIAAGENAGNVYAFEQMISAGAVDVAQPSATKVGGVTGLVKVAQICDQADCRLVSHCAYFGPGYWANLQFLASRNDGSLAEFYYVAGLQDSLYGDCEFPRNGAMHLPDGPGLGIDPDESRVRALHQPKSA
ncbi:MAG: mandelate racemase/muconate lactonizing enzyme family protein [Boseongicola sp.]